MSVVRPRLSSLSSSSGSTPSSCPPISPSSTQPNPDSTPRFAVTPAEFNLFPSARSANSTSTPQNESQDDCLGLGHLTALRSAAFWELRRSVIENGEGLIRRMRDYELARLHENVRLKAKERVKRIRKSSARASRCKTRPNGSKASDDDVLIYSEDPSNALLRWSPLVTKSRSLDSMDVDEQGQDLLERRFSRSTPGPDTNYDKTQHYYGVGTEKAEANSESLLSYPESASLTPSLSSASSSPLLPSLSRTSSPLLSLQTTSSEKALAELNIAFANGACCITDYSPIWTYQQQLNMDEHDTGHGDLWH